MARLNIISNTPYSSTPTSSHQRPIPPKAERNVAQGKDQIIERCSANSNAKTISRLRSAHEDFSPSMSAANMKQMDIKTKSQRPLRKLEHNELLLQKKFDASSDESKAKQNGIKMDSMEAIDDVRIGRGYREKSKLVQASYRPFSSDSEDEQDHNDFLADLQFWTITKPILPKSLTKPEGNASTPRANRAQIRSVKMPTSISIEQDPVPNHGISVTLEPLKRSHNISNRPDSRPTSSYNGDPCALLSFEPARKLSPVKASQISRPSTPTGPKPPTKVLLKSPAKMRTIPKSPFHHAVDDFWSQDVVNNWNDQYSPQKTSQSPRKKKLVGSNSGDEDGYVTPCASPKKSPTKKDKTERDARKAFEARKDGLAKAFLQRLDSEITQGKISELSKDTGGVQLIWSKKLNSTAGRANWRREATVTKHSNGSIEKIYKHFANIELAEKVIDEEHRLYNTLAHEFCHLANFMISGIKDNPHGKEFKVW